MPTVRFTKHLLRYYPALQTAEVEGGTVAAVIAALEERYHGLSAYFVDDQGRLREHVNIFIGKDLIRDRESLSDPVQANDTIFILQALSGG
ncbi:molybdopterin synthase subunit MoaD [Longilinea arvoryzae]|uniref:Molybdopterin synthase subunit MoaD n=1 Tax=Longilinea arvoryzae TaxID=360412 RepID=A0A0S7BD11_9CHLR|nr:MoaD/ThiS family protein [Longilinea arvoryzae]GAP12596.1 molybdopterin synthase subunit MoaD [Longilinea arvoryzae]